jgi:hypothetical protein
MEQAFFLMSDMGVSLNRLHIRRHQGKGFFLPVFALPQTPDRRLVLRVHGQVKPAQTLDGDNMTGL